MLQADRIGDGSTLPQAFLSYAHSDDHGLEGAITWLRGELERKLLLLTGRQFTIFQDRNDIEFGQNWPRRLDEALQQSRFLIPILTPSFFMSDHCRGETEKFLGFEAEAERQDLILPIYLITAEVLEQPELRERDELAMHLYLRQRSDWRDPTMQWRSDPAIQQKIIHLAGQIDRATKRLSRPERKPPPPGEGAKPRRPLPPPPQPLGPIRDSRSLIGLSLGLAAIAVAAGVGAWRWLPSIVAGNERDLAPTEMASNTPPSGETALLQAMKARADKELAALADTIREPGRTFRDCLDCPKMVVVEAGRFTMGSAAGRGERDELPAHVVAIPEDFAIGVYEVTFAEWDACVADGGCEQQPDDQGWSQGDPKQRALLPVMNVNWYDAQEYVAWLRKKTGRHYRLPSEAEWEYAARGGTETRYFWGDQGIGCKYANGADMAYKRVSDVSSQAIMKCDDGFAFTAPVGSFAPNDFGIYDTAGNVGEWVEDHKSDDYQNVPADGTVHLVAGTDFNHHVIRGGDWSKRPESLRSANRLQSERKSQENVIGFRVLRDLDG